MHNKLIEIPSVDWIDLRDMYVNRKVEASGYYTLKTLCEWEKKCPEVSIKIYSLNGLWREDGTFIAIMSPFSNVFCNTLSEDLTSLKLALSVLDTKPFYRFFGFPERLLGAIKEFFSYCGLTDEEFRADGTAWYHISKEKALKFDVNPPENISLGQLKDSNCEEVNNVWPFRAKGSEIFVSLLIRNNESVGAWDSEGNLVSWCLRLPLGSLGLLQVIESHKRKGLGSLMVRYMAKMLAEKDEEPLAPVVFVNTPSRSMFEKLGFQVIDNTYWSEKKELQ